MFASIYFHAIAYISYITALLVLCGIIYAAVISHQEKEPRARNRFLMAGLPVILLFSTAGLLAAAHWWLPSLVLLAGFYGSLLYFFLPRKAKAGSRLKPTGQIDERITMFSRRLLQPGTQRYQEYYKNYPHHHAPDEAFRKLPGLLSDKAAFYEPKAFQSAEAHFNIIEQARPMVEGPVAAEKTECKAESVSRYLKKLARLNGAHSAGITSLKPYHLYSYRGRDHNYGEKVHNSHNYALAITVPMNRDLIRNAPYAATIVESSRQYVRSGMIALELAQFIRNLGYSARAHIDGEYEVVCPLVARDAGLGETGRMGLLMTPRLGPRVRIAVVTTSLPLQENEPGGNHTVEAFCRICKKCAETCPAKAIPFADPQPVKGIKRWQINQEACFTYWCRTGTDCGRCISVCPFSHPDNPLHQVVRYGIRNSGLFRHIALKMDDWFYGRKPVPLKNPLEDDDSQQ